MNDKCRQLGSELAELKELRDEFARELELGVRDRDLNSEELRDLRDVINALLKGDTELAKLREEMAPRGLEHLKLREQYESQVKVAWRSGLFGDGLGEPVIERNGQNYPMPGWKEVQKILSKPKNREIIKAKSAQGFTQMLIVPFGYDLKTMAHKFKDKVRELDQAGLNPDGSSNPQKGIFGAGGEKVEFKRDDSDYPVWIWDGWDESQLTYYPKQYARQDHGGQIKEDAIKINGAWQICFVEDLEKMAVIPLEGKEVGGRKQIDRKGSSIKGQTRTPTIQQYKEAMDDKQKMINPEKYKHENGMIPEKYLWMQLTSLLAKEKPVLMDYENNEWRGTYLIECYSAASVFVPVVCWSETSRQFLLDREISSNQTVNYGARSSVDIMK